MSFTYQSAQISSAIEWLKTQAGTRRVILFSGDLGAGKTTLVKAFSQMLGGVSKLSSPTFSIVNEYASPNGEIYHIDLYRLNSTEEAIETGLEDYLLSGNWCLVEWPEIALPLLRINEFIHVKITTVDTDTREISLL